MQCGRRLRATNLLTVIGNGVGGAQAIAREEVGGQSYQRGPPPVHISCAGGHLIEKANHRRDPIAVAHHEVGALYHGLVPHGAQTP